MSMANISEARPLFFNSFVKNPSSALGFIFSYCYALVSAPHSLRFALVASGVFTVPSDL